MAPLTARELNSKRKRERMSEEDGDETKMTKRCEEENVCPNGSVDKTTPVRKARGQTKGGQKLFSSGGDATKVKETGEKRSTVFIPVHVCNMCRVVLLMIISAKDNPMRQCEGLKHFFVFCFFQQITSSFYFLQLREQERRRGLWEERLLRVQPGQRVGKPRLPRRRVSLSIHMTYLFFPTVSFFRESS